MIIYNGGAKTFYLFRIIPILVISFLMAFGIQTLMKLFY